MDFYYIPTKRYVPTYTRTDFTDALYEVFGFRTDYEIVSTKNMKNYFKETKKRKHYSVFKRIKNPGAPYLQDVSGFRCLPTVKYGILGSVKEKKWLSLAILFPFLHKTAPFLFRYCFFIKLFTDSNLKNLKY